MAEDKLKLLVVEDDEDIARAMSTYATHYGYDAHVAHDGNKAVELALELRPDVLLLDIHLPHMDGRDVMRKIKEAGITENSVVIFVSARDEQSDRLMGLELGADDYETKPVHFNSLFTKVERLLKKKRGE